MAKHDARDKKCPFCGDQTLRDEGSHHKCGNCLYIGWSWWQRHTGSARGTKCPACERQTMHEMAKLEHGEIVR